MDLVGSGEVVVIVQGLRCLSLFSLCPHWELFRVAPRNTKRTPKLRWIDYVALRYYWLFFGFNNTIHFNESHWSSLSYGSRKSLTQVARQRRTLADECADERKGKASKGKGREGVGTNLALCFMWSSWFAVHLLLCIAVHRSLLSFKWGGGGWRHHGCKNTKGCLT